MNKKFGFDENRTFGVEIEVLTNNVNQYLIANSLMEAGVDAVAESYNHNTRGYWKVITDSSCGYEVVSPVLKGKAGLEEVEKVCAVLNRIGCKVDKRCGLHVHHSVADYSIKNFQNLYFMYAKYENAIDQIMPVSRRGNNATYCGSMLSGYTYEELVRELERCSSIQGIEYVFPTRYKKLNCKSFVKYGTIEFRHHSGTTNAKKITSWIKLTQGMVTKCKISNVAKKKVKEYDDIGSLLYILGMLRSNEIHEDFEGLLIYYRARQKKFRKNQQALAA